MLLALAQVALAADPILRAPYLQTVTATEATLCWMTGEDTRGRVRFGLAPDKQDRAITTETGRLHAVRLTGLSPDTTWYYTVEVDGAPITEGEQASFTTAPPPGSRAPIRAWVVGDSGMVNEAQLDVLRAWYRFNGGLGDFDPLDPGDLAALRPDLYLHTGDIAYNSATEEELTEAVFEVYQPLLAGTSLWPTYGNHDGYSADSALQEGPWFDAFVLPADGAAGGVPSGREDWYSFRWGNAHFISLNAYDADRLPGSPMLTWLEEDLAAAGADPDVDWVIAYWHHPPYSKGTHDSDSELELVEMREHVNPILEAGGVDLVLSGHSHTYERSYLIDGAYETPTGTSGLLDTSSGDPLRGEVYRKAAGITPRAGAVYAVAGHGGASVGLRGEHPLMAFVEARHGSVVLDIEGDTLRLSNVRSDGALNDRVALLKGRALMAAWPDGGELLLPGEGRTLRWLSSGDFDEVLLEFSPDGGRSWSEIARAPDTGSYPWIVPQIETDAARFRVSDPGDPAIADMSGAPFRIGEVDLFELAGADSEWRYTDAADEPKADWYTESFDDSGWEVGTGPFGYGEGDEGTVLAPDRISYYLRRDVELDREVLAARLEARIDDGAQIYINGQPALDWNVAGTGHQDYASQRAAAGETARQVLPPELFKAGRNLIAVQLKQHGSDTSDLALSLELRAVLGEPVSAAGTPEIVSDSGWPENKGPGPGGQEQPAEDSAGSAEPGPGGDSAAEGAAVTRPEPRCACGAGPAASAAGWLGALLLATRRRRDTPEAPPTPGEPA